ncbi:FKBP-type peptidyl-prolyl cis-trans isomerase [Cellulomonas sp. Root137]|uniref:FKBP-type peptidyl-prolyl cis-trans isomerase n=1 Tax=Cellulomonas sp. Root137 TaxID=1736459 RepID=UPI0006F2A4BC|nr:FKBP-type peptidyl-prolyl cis-trans isomerase [Cellulomonas sp. Root137]KQY46226.1 FKBP-type peptidylprolyl isomerase [Cellulomonas sp. Root137]KRD43374.1 FKBP-type peptidylprolyl isomerase [Cellulomonas sp. Root930]
MRRTTTARRGLAAAALALTLGLSLAACAGDSADDPTPSATSTSTADPADVAALAKVEVEGEPGSKPTITLPTTPFTVSALVVRVVDEGTGDEITEGQTLSIQTTAVSGTDGTELGDTYSSTPEKIVADDQLLPDLHDALVGQKVGVRILFAVPDGEGTNVVVGEVVEANDTVPALERAEGEAVTPPAGLPTVTLDADGKPSITPLTDPAPTTLVAQPLIKGTGAEVTEDQTLTVNYTGWLWDGTQFDSSWDSGEPATFALTGVIPGWTQGLAGQTVGSQVLLVIPPDLGYGDQASETIPAGSTLIFVVDILGAV